MQLQRWISTVKWLEAMDLALHTSGAHTANGSSAYLSSEKLEHPRDLCITIAISRNFEETPATSRDVTNGYIETSYFVPDSVPCCLTLFSNHISRRPANPKAMAWMSTGSTNAALIKNLTSNGLITSERVKNAMSAVCYQHLLQPPIDPLGSSPLESSTFKKVSI